MDVPPNLGAILGREILKPQGRVVFDDCNCVITDDGTRLVLDACADFELTSLTSGCAMSGFIRGAAIRRRFDLGELK